MSVPRSAAVTFNNTAQVLKTHSPRHSVYKSLSFPAVWCPAVPTWSAGIMWTTEIGHCVRRSDNQPRKPLLSRRPFCRKAHLQTGDKTPHEPLWESMDPSDRHVSFSHIPQCLAWVFPLLRGRWPESHDKNALMLTFKVICPPGQHGCCSPRISFFRGHLKKL